MSEIKTARERFDESCKVKLPPVMPDVFLRGCLEDEVTDLRGRIKQLEQELAEAKKDQARYKFVRDMSSEDFGNLSTIDDDFDCQIDTAIKESK